uniref:Uncharacterized protein n=1 Tax=Anguilla anguilla TaxID=7936 RepID=A0A0E9XP22_ANGAN
MLISVLYPSDNELTHVPHLFIMGREIPSQGPDITSLLPFLRIAQLENHSTQACVTSTACHIPQL